MIYDVAILGAGASGLMVASCLNDKDKKVCIIDNMSQIGEKIKISGGKKCNITNQYLSSKKYLGDEEFINKVFERFDNYDLFKFIEEHGINPILSEKIVKGAYFCHNSKDVIIMFQKYISKIKLFLNTMVEDIQLKDDNFIIIANNKTIESKKLIIASGGLSYPVLGATGIGFEVAKFFGHNVIAPNPALVGFTVQKEQFWFKELSGLRIENVSIKVGDKICNGNMLFTHKGCSGPVILSTSLYWNKGQISIDFSPTKGNYLPKRFRQAIKNLNIDIHNYKMSPAGNFGYTKAEVTKGGVDTSQIDVNTMQSILQKNLYFAGEVMNVTGELGGYNLQWAFSSAKIVSSAIFR
ncbi:NAD(FAD)-utilizing dehydrogenases [hydrothermal vent metagenome]|uniref:NAD(FAD)-utilizing dehydrogenases n=1 Tax=hydrothermal vent metagenome TaxID=652676 RepID=A0A3B1EA02_9ZZZZ